MSSSPISIPDFGPTSRCDHAAEYEGLRRLAERHGVDVQTGQGGWWQGGWPAIWFSRRADAAEDGQPRPLFGLFLRDAGWLLNGCPSLHFLPERGQVEGLCLALFERWPCYPAGGLLSTRFRLDDDLREAFGLVAVSGETVRQDAEAARARRLERLGWRRLAGEQEDETWARYAARFGYPAGGGFRTPTPSVTWDISPIYLRSGEEFAGLEEDLARKVLTAFRVCTPAGQELYALDWNHPCYSLDPHGVVAEAGESWAVPVLPNGDHYIFLAPDFRFGVIGDCVEQTICVYGQPLLDALATDAPLVFRKPALTAEERQARREDWVGLGWRRLSCDERDEYRDGFYETFRFSPHARQDNGSCFREPCPSLVWDISEVLQAVGQERESMAAELTLEVLAAFRRATPPGETLLAIDVLRFHEHYAFDPYRLASAAHEQWAHPVLPDDNFSVFLARDYRFGLVGDPVRRTLCVFGWPLLDVFVADLPGCLGSVVRRDGLEVDGPLIVPREEGEG
jgi:hypothetical protein